MKAFLSYKFGDDISIILNLLTSKNVEVFDSLSDIQYGESLQQAIRNAVRDCDFVVFIYSEDNPYIAFESGLAVALNKPVFSILAGGEENLFLLDSTYVHAHPSEYEKIKFSLDLFLKKMKPQEKLTSPTVFYGGGEAIPMQSYFDVEEHYRLLKNNSASTLEEFFEEIFKAYSVNYVKNSKVKFNEEVWSADFSIWSDELSFILSNPIIIEIKAEINSSNIKSLLQNLEKLSYTPISSVIIFYEHLVSIRREDLPNTQNRLFISIPEFVKELKGKGFASCVKRIRNTIMHNV